jgi:peptide/nickel transport system permease protein
VLAYVVRRLLGTIPVMGVVALFVFSLLHLTPGDPAVLIAGELATDADIAAIRAKLGLDEPFLFQLGTWIWSLMRGDLGISIFTDLPVTRLIGQRLEPTLMLTLTTVVVAIAVALPLGIVSAWKAGTWIDTAVMSFAVFGFSVPVFVLGFVLILVFSLQLDWFPVQGYTSISEGFLPFIHNITLPSISLGLIYAALIARITRASMLDVLAQDYIRTADSKGLPTFDVLIRHGLKNAAVPIVTIIGIGVALLIGGVVVTETVFAIPGMGRLVVDSIVKRDYPVVQGMVLVFSGVYVLINLLVDLSYTLLDPRIRY